METVKSNLDIKHKAFQERIENNSLGVDTYEVEVGRIDVPFAPGIKIESPPVRAGVGVL